MDEKLTISVQISGYGGKEALTRILNGILMQKTKKKLEINLVDNGTVAELEALLNDIITKENISYNIITDPLSYFAVENATGKYVAFCCYNDFWSDENKLEKQIEILEKNPEYSSCVHDINLLNKNKLPYRHAVQQRYKKQRFTASKVYTYLQLQENILPAPISTLICRNIFQDDMVKRWITSETKNPKQRLYTAVVLSGSCYNFVNEMMASRIALKPYRSALSACNYETALNEIKELDAICQFASEYSNKKFDKSYRLIQIASLNFEVYKKSGKSSEELQHFIELYDLAYDVRYDAPTEECHEFAHEKAFFEYLRKKVYWYQIAKGTEEELPLLKHLNILNDDARIERIMQCYTQKGAANRQIRKMLIENAEDVNLVKKTVRYRLLSAPFRRISRKLQNYGKKAHRNFKRIITRRLRKQGFSEYMANEWYDSVRINLLTDKTTPLKDKLWCYRRGFMPWRLFQYGVNDDNYKKFLSDRDYMFLHQINNSYKKWIEDKMTFRYVLEPFKEYLPKYYFQIIRREGCSLILPLMDCPQGYGPTIDDLLRLLRDKGTLALKAASGTHGIGFYKMSYENGKYYMNNEESSEYEISQIIRGFKNFYIVTEYVRMHDEIKRLYAGSVNTLRLMVINRTGYDPQILDAYMRVGSSTTGTTDNVAFGGVFCKIDIDTGHYGNAEQSKNHVLVACPNHPDTNEPVEGMIPNWELIKQKIIEISKYIGQLEYLGFDVVCTPEGFTILEINSHQDLHRYIYYDERIKKFYFDKLEYKRRLYKQKHKLGIF